VSTAEQSTSPQVSQLLAGAERLGLAVPPERVYTDEGVSGSLDHRPSFDRLCEAVRAREISAVLVTKLDRIGRSVKGLLEFYDLAESSGVRVIVTDQGIDTGTAAGRLLRTMLAGVAEFERDLIVDRTRSRMDALKAGMPTRSGRPVGRPRRVTPEKVAEAQRLLASVPRPKWSIVAQRVGLPLETIRKAVRERSRAVRVTGTVGNTPESN